MTLYLPDIDTLQVDLAPLGGIPDQVHLFERRQVKAVNAALAAGRPLLVRGEPGTGKSQLARAAAKALKRVYVHYPVDAQTEARDLLWHLDSLQRLAEAQLAGALRDVDPAAVRERLATDNFLRPGPLWWVFDWAGAVAQAGRSGTAVPVQKDGGLAENGCVLLVDEIDKAEPEVPNGLLDALGSGTLTPPGWAAPVAATGPTPLIIITSNEERALPDAFLRRCLVLELALPAEDADLIAMLTRRGKAHFSDLDDGVLRQAAEMLAEDRKAAREHQSRALPGQAEYLDLLRAVRALYPKNPKHQTAALAELADYTLKKYAGA